MIPALIKQAGTPDDLREVADADSSLVHIAIGKTSIEFSRSWNGTIFINDDKGPACLNINRAHDSATDALHRSTITHIHRFRLLCSMPPLLEVSQCYANREDALLSPLWEHGSTLPEVFQDFAPNDGPAYTQVGDMPDLQYPLLNNSEEEHQEHDQRNYYSDLVPNEDAARKASSASENVHGVDGQTETEEEEEDELMQSPMVCSDKNIIPKPRNMHQYRSWKSIPYLPEQEIPVIRKTLRSLRKTCLQAGKPWSRQPKSVRDRVIREAIAACPILECYEDAWPVVAVSREHLTMSNYRSRRGLQRTARSIEATRGEETTDVHGGLKIENQVTSNHSRDVESTLSNSSVAEDVVANGDVSQEGDLQAVGIAFLQHLRRMSGWEDEQIRRFLQLHSGLSAFHVANILDIIQVFSAHAEIEETPVA
ncbi:hypothetical protein NM688_g569 [Phlebia brevispora]|uniref:Uncharacterized protein n=1 Tax=Phlebia brevispora TaxID=194682 RepID=A0ACC1TDS4_9APHY|nr:hypothetical protein NM688_g569 [Phlebia brevispora]